MMAGTYLGRKIIIVAQRPKGWICSRNTIILTPMEAYMLEMWRSGLHAGLTPEQRVEVINLIRQIHAWAPSAAA